MSSIGFSNPLTSSAAAQFLSSLNSPTSGKAAEVSGGTDTTSGVSTFSQLLSKLNDLSQSDPAKFKTLTAQIASQLKTAAGNATGSDAQALNKLSGEFAQASSDGNISALEPSRQTQSSGSVHHRHHHGGAEAYQANASSDTASTAQSSSLESVLQTVLNEVKQS